MYSRAVPQLGIPKGTDPRFLKPCTVPAYHACVSTIDILDISASLVISITCTSLHVHRIREMNPSRKTLRPKAPDKGSFPLDHEGTATCWFCDALSHSVLQIYTGECKEFMQQYMECLKRRNNDNYLCRAESKAYLQCRMDK